MKHGSTVQLSITSAPAQEIDMLTYTSSGSITGPNPTWTAFNSAGYETSGANPLIQNANVANKATILNKLFVQVDQVPGVGENVVFTIFKSTDNGATWNPTAITCTLGAAAVIASDTTHSATFAAGDLWSLKILASNGNATTALAVSISQM